MTLSVNQNINRAQAFKGISPLNAAYLNINGDDKQQQSQAAAPAKAQLIEPLQTTQAMLLKCIRQKALHKTRFLTPILLMLKV